MWIKTNGHIVCPNDPKDTAPIHTLHEVGMYPPQWRGAGYDSLVVEFFCRECGWTMERTFCIDKDETTMEGIVDEEE